jgi:hypothetical protein
MSGEQAAALDGSRRALLVSASLLTLGLPVMVGLSATPLAVVVQRHVVAVQARAAEAVTVVAEQIGMTPISGKAPPVEVRKLRRLKLVAARPVAPPPTVTSVTTSDMAPDPSPPVVAQSAVASAPETGSPQQVAAQTVGPTPAKEVVLALDPRGNGDPDAVTCRVPQQLPASRLPGPEVCRTNRFWAALYAEGRRLSPDGLTLTAATPRFGEEGKFCSAPILGARAGLGIDNSVLRACR